MARKFEDIKYNILEFDLSDYKLIIEKKIKTSSFYTKYPFIYFWFIKNKQFKDGDVFFNCYTEEEKKYIIEEKKLPFWLICLRIYYSLNYIISDYNSYLDYKFKSIICDVINLRLQKY